MAKCPFPVAAGTDVTPRTAINYLSDYTGSCDVQGLGVFAVTSTCTFSVVDKSYQASIQDLLCDFGKDWHYFGDLRVVVDSFKRFKNVLETNISSIKVTFI